MERTEAALNRPSALFLFSMMALVLPAPPAAAGTVRGRLVLGGKPAAGGTVSALPFEEPFSKARREARGEPEPTPLATTTTAADGTFALTVSETPGRETVFRVRFAAPGAVAAEHLGVREAAESEELGEITLRKAEAIAGRVVGPAARPVAGARVILLPLGRFSADGGLLPPVPLETTTGPDGTFRFEHAAPEGNQLVVAAAGFAPVRVPGTRAGALRRPIVLAAGASLTGRVEKPGGRPAAGALVRHESVGLETRWVETGEDGAFRLSDLPLRAGTVVADAGPEGFVAATVRPEAGRLSGPLVLAPPTVLEGRVLDAATRKAVPRAKVTAGAESESRTTWTAADGSWRFRGLRPGEVTVRADERRFVAWTRNGVRLAKGETVRLDIPLTYGAAISGRVVDEDGFPVAGAKLSVSPRGETAFSIAVRRLAGDPGAGIVSRADGSFSAERLSPGANLRITTYHPDFERGVQGGVTLVPGGARAGVIVALRRGVVVTGAVKDLEGRPVAGAEVGVAESRVVRSSSGARQSMSFGGFPDLAPARSGPDGRFELRGVPPGDWAVKVKASGFATRVVDPLKLSRGARPEPLEVVLPPGASVSGIVRRKTGEGAEGYLVLAREPGQPPMGIDPESMSTGPDGVFVLEGLEKDTAYDLQLFGGATFGPGPRKRGVVPPASDLEWVVEGLGRIEGIAVDAKTGEPIPSFEVSCEPEQAGFDGMRARRGMGSLVGGGVGLPVAVEASDGRFVLEEIPAGTWQVVVTAKGFQPGRAGGVVVEEGTTTEGVDVRVPRGVRLEVLVLDVRTRKGVPEASVSIDTETGAPAFGDGALGGSALQTDVDGKVEGEGLAPGKVTVTVHHPDYTGATESTLLSEAGGRVEVALSRGGALAGVVLSETRQRVPGAEVSLVGAGTEGRRFGTGGETVADGSGRFRFEHLAPGRYTLRARAAGQATEPVEAVLLGEQGNEDVTLVLTGGATLRGAVTGLPAELRADVTVNASGPNDYWASARTGPDGRFELSGAPAGTISLRATAGRFLSGSTRSALATVTLAEGQREAEADVVFEEGGVLSGRVLRGGQPVPEARVSANDMRLWLSASARTDESGAYRIEGLEAGSYTVVVRTSLDTDGRGVTREVRVDGEATLDVDLPTASLFGVVVDAATKRPLADARVAAGPDDPATGRTGWATTDSSGRFLVEALGTGAHTLVVRRSGYQEVRETAEATEAGGDAGTIEMTRGDGLELNVRDGIFGLPLGSVSVRVTDPAGAIVLSTWVGLDGEGKGEIRSLRPGRYGLVLGSDGYATKLVESVVVPGAPLPVVLTPGGSVEVRSGEASRARGAAMLRDTAGRPYPYRARGGAGELSLSPAGTQLLPNLAPGSYTLGVEGAAPKAFTVTEGSRTVVELP